MMRAHPMATGILIGIVGTWAYHKFLRPLPGGGATGAFSGKQ